MTKGICRSPACPAAAGATPIDRYPGPGEYCPECGERLEPVEIAEPAPAPAPPSTAPFGGLTALQALQQFEAEHPPFPEPPPPRRRSRTPVAVAAGALVLAVAAGFVVMRPAAIGRSAEPHGVRVCRSSLSERVAGDVLAAYAAKSRRVDAPFTIAHDGACDVRFSALASPPSGAAVVARDAIVAVVNPQNPLARLTPAALRAVLAGEITDWSQLGGRPGRIAAVVPGDATDEGAALARAVLGGAHPAAAVRRVATSADVVTAVAGPAGRAALGIAAFSGAVPAKVVRLGSAPAPSMISIADQGYPLTVAVVVEAVGSAPPAAADLVRFARSDDAQAIVARDGLVPMKGI